MPNSRSVVDSILERVNTNWVLGLGFGLGLALYGFRPRKRPLKRSVSFTSVGLAKGTFPPEANVGEPIINSACYFGNGGPSQEEVVEHIIRPLIEYDRMSKVLDVDACSFQPTRQFSPQELVREVTVSGDVEAVHRTIFNHSQDTLKREGLPWWEILVVRNTGKGPSACVIRVHHSLGDGLALVGAFQDILTNADGTPLKIAPPSLRAKTKAKTMFQTVNSLVAATFHVLTLGASKYDNSPLASGPGVKHSGHRDYVLFPTVPLEFIKDLKNSAHVSVNDILMTAVSQAIHGYCQKRSALSTETQCRALLTVGFPRTATDKNTSLVNKWVLVSCDLGVGIDGILDRLAFVHSKTQEMKEKPRALMQLLIQNAITPYLPIGVARQAVSDVFSRHSLVLTNVPGPSEKCCLAGKVVDDVQLFFDNILNQFNLLSYGGQVYGNVVYDSAALPDFEDLGKSYGMALVQLAELLNVETPSCLRSYSTK